MLRICTKIMLLFCCIVFLAACGKKTLNNPYPRQDAGKNYYYSSFTERPKTLDPARSYSTNEAIFTGQIYEPPLQYDYLKRPYQLVPLTASHLPVAVYYDKSGKELTGNVKDSDIAYTLYTIHIKPNIMFQPHPAFAKDASGNYLYHHLSPQDLNQINRLSDFKQTGSRELIAADYVYQIQRLADPEVQSPIFGFLSEYIVGLTDYAKLLQKIYQEKTDKSGSDTNDKNVYIDYRQFPFEGAKVIDRYTYQIKIKGKYPQFLYWLAMPFFAPVPWEADYFYSQPKMIERNISFDWFPVGTGPYLLSENNPNKEMVLDRNPNFRGEIFPNSGDASDIANGYLINADKKMPFVDKFIYSLEKESIPRWSKFLQGYYDASAISSDSFDQAIIVNDQGEPVVTPEMSEKGIKLETTVDLGTFYVGFNMHDETIGGYTERARNLRKAIAIAVDYQDYISIFLNERGIVAQSPLPPGIFGYQSGKEGIDSNVYVWQRDRPERKPIEDAKKLLALAGYPGGVDIKTHEKLILNYDTVSRSGPDDKAHLDWMRKQFDKIGIDLHIRATTYNEFQDKMRTGDVQIYSWGWHADYPDPENFLFLLYGPNGKIKFGGENASNYENKEFDKLFEQMKLMDNGPARLQVISRMIQILQNDAPWVWGYHPVNFSLRQAWLDPIKPNSIANNGLKYIKLNPATRSEKRSAWNQPIWWPITYMLFILFILILPVIVKFWYKEYKPKARQE